MEGQKEERERERGEERRGEERGGEGREGGDLPITLPVHLQKWFLYK